jgi:hypothetical protein
MPPVASASPLFLLVFSTSCLPPGIFFLSFQCSHLLQWRAQTDQSWPKPGKEVKPIESIITLQVGPIKWSQFCSWGRGSKYETSLANWFLWAYRCSWDIFIGPPWNCFFLLQIRHFQLHVHVVFDILTLFPSILNFFQRVPYFSTNAICFHGRVQTVQTTDRYVIMPFVEEKNSKGTGKWSVSIWWLFLQSTCADLPWMWDKSIVNKNEVIHQNCIIRASASHSPQSPWLIKPGCGYKKSSSGW